jgi:hypothetical protein
MINKKRPYVPILLSTKMAGAVELAARGTEEAGAQRPA